MFRLSWWVWMAGLCVWGTLPVPAADIPIGVLPGKTWATKTPAEVGLDAGKLREFSEFVGGRGCVVRHGYLVYHWGDITRREDIASAAKPFYSYFLFKALELGKIPSLDQRVGEWEPRLADLDPAHGRKNRDILWRHLANQTSCYGVVERPGTAFCYNDWQTMLLWQTLFLKVYGARLESVDAHVFHPLLTDPLGCEDDPTMLAFGPGDRPGRIAISPRDFARFGLLYLHRGQWRDRRLLAESNAVLSVTRPLPNFIPRTRGEKAELLPGADSVGSRAHPDNQTDHFGSYSWFWWLNGVDRQGQRMFPGVPEDLFGAFGHGGPRAMWVIPSLDLIVSYNDAQMEQWVSGPDNPTGKAMRLMLKACPP